MAESRIFVWGSLATSTSSYNNNTFSRCFSRVFLPCVSTVCFYRVFLQCVSTVCFYNVFLQLVSTVCFYCVLLQCVSTVCFYSVFPQFDSAVCFRDKNRDKVETNRGKSETTPRQRRDNGRPRSGRTQKQKYTVNPGFAQRASAKPRRPRSHTNTHKPLFREFPVWLHTPQLR